MANYYAVRLNEGIYAIDTGDSSLSPELYVFHDPDSISNWLKFDKTYSRLNYQVPHCKRISKKDFKSYREAYRIESYNDVMQWIDIVNNLIQVERF